jgi:hypothetical protein
MRRRVKGVVEGAAVEVARHAARLPSGLVSPNCFVKLIAAGREHQTEGSSPLARTTPSASAAGTWTGP